jgi:hypothetical protein
MGSNHVPHKTTHAERTLVFLLFALLVPILAFAIVANKFPSQPEVTYLLHKVDHGLSLLRGLQVARAIVSKAFEHKSERGCANGFPFR